MTVPLFPCAFSSPALAHDSIPSSIAITNLFTTTTDQEYGDLIDEDGGAATHLYDAQANTNVMLDASGAVVAQYKYYAFGNVSAYDIGGSGWAGLATNAWNSTSISDLTPPEGSVQMLTGGKKQYYLDQETALFLLGRGNNGRYYDSTTTRFTSDDPIHQAGGINAQRYAGE